MKHTVLPNGVHVLLYPMREVQSLRIHVYAKGGSLIEPADRNGLAHFMEHMLLQGTPTYKNAQSIANYIESIAGSFNAYTSDREISFYTHVPHHYFSEVIRLAHEIWFHSTFPEEAFEKEKRAVLSEAAQKLDTLDYRLAKFSKEKRFHKGSPLQRFTIGTIESVSSVRYQDIIDFWKKFFTTDNTYVLIVGHMDEDKILDVINDTFGKEPASHAPELFTDLSEHDFAPSGVHVSHDEKMQSNYFDVSLPTHSLESERKLRMIANLAVTTFGGLSTSPLFRILRWEKGLVYNASIYSYRVPHLAEMLCTTEVRSEQFYEAADLLVDLLTGYIRTGPTHEEFMHTKQFLEDRTRISFDEPADIISWLKKEFLWEQDIMLPPQSLDMLKTITQKDIVQLLSEINVSKTQIIQQGPLEDNATLRKFLEKQRAKMLQLH